MTAEESFQCQEDSNEDSPSEEHPLRILRTRGGEPAEAVGVEDREQSVIRRERALIEHDERCDSLAWESPETCLPAPSTLLGINSALAEAGCLPPETYSYLAHRAVSPYPTPHDPEPRRSSHTRSNDRSWSRPLPPRDSPLPPHLCRNGLPEDHASHQ